MKTKFKRTIIIILTATLSLLLITPAFATENVNITVNEIPETMVSYLTDEKGNVIIIEGVMVDKPMTVSDNEYAVTYSYALPKSLLASGSLPIEDQDPSISLQAELTIYFERINIPYEYLLTHVEGSWELLDSSVTILNKTMAYHCSGALPILTGQSETVQNITHYFYYYTWFTDYVSSAGTALVGAQMDFRLQHGSSVWNWSLPNYILDID